MSDPSVDLDRRELPRQALERVAKLSPNEWSSIQVTLVDLSEHGFRVRCDAMLRVGSFVLIGIAGIGQVSAKVIWRRDGEFGAKFIRPLNLQHCEWTKGDAADILPGVEEAAELARALASRAAAR